MSNGLEALFRPRSVAVIGASRDEHSIGAAILHNLIEFGFSGPVYPVNPSTHSVHAMRSYPSIVEVPEQVDLAVVVVPAPHVLDVVGECGEAGVKALVTISAGFKEMGAKDLEPQPKLTVGRGSLPHETQVVLLDYRR